MSQIETSGVMSVGGSREGTFGGRRPPLDPQPSSAPASRALTLVAAPASHEAPILTRGDAAFLAHLIATKEQAPQTRLKRRAEPAEVLAAYRAVAALVD
ncbi:MAG: hypothetical protein ACTHLO_05770 [Pseudolabrys sp.]